MFSQHFLECTVFLSMDVLLTGYSPPFSPCFLCLPLFYQCDGCLFLLPSALGLMAGIPIFGSHGNSLHLSVVEIAEGVR